MNTEEKIRKARTALVLDHPFFGCLALKLKLVESDEYTTCTVDGQNLFYNPDFVQKLSNQETIGVLAHEIMHLALGHGWRQDNRETDVWNNATDYTINYNLRDIGFVLPGLDKEYNYGPYKELSAEEIYTKLIQQRMPSSNSGNGKGNNQQQGGQQGNQNQQQQKNKDKKSKKKHKKEKQKKQNQDKQQQKQKQPQNIDPNGCGAVIPPKNKQQANDMKAEWKAAVNQALQIARGTLSADLERQVQEILETHIPWYILLRDFIEKSARNDYNWNRPSRRYFPRGFILPSLISEEIPEIDIAIDTSMSISQKDLSIFAAETSAVLESYNTTIRVFYCDAKIKGEEVFSRADLPLNLKTKGGGGTKFEPVFEHIEKNGYIPNCLIYFTDLAGSFPEKQPNYPTMWLVKTEDKQIQPVPFGITIKF
jgi:predicted metal-dependent peptidase